MQKKTFEEAKAREEKRKQMILSSMGAAEARQQVLAEEKARSIERKKQEAI